MNASPKRGKIVPKLRANYEKVPETKNTRAQSDQYEKRNAEKGISPRLSSASGNGHMAEEHDQFRKTALPKKTRAKSDPYERKESMITDNGISPRLSSVFGNGHIAKESDQFGKTAPLKETQTKLDQHERNDEKGIFPIISSVFGNGQIAKESDQYKETPQEKRTRVNFDQRERNERNDDDDISSNSYYPSANGHDGKDANPTETAQVIIFMEPRREVRPVSESPMKLVENINDAEEKSILERAVNTYNPAVSIIGEFSELDGPNNLRESGIKNNNNDRSIRREIRSMPPNRIPEKIIIKEENGRHNRSQSVPMNHSTVHNNMKGNETEETSTDDMETTRNKMRYIRSEEWSDYLSLFNKFSEYSFNSEKNTEFFFDTFPEFFGFTFHRTFHSTKIELVDSNFILLNVFIIIYNMLYWDRKSSSPSHPLATLFSKKGGVRSFMIEWHVIKSSVIQLLNDDILNKYKQWPYTKSFLKVILFVIIMKYFGKKRKSDIMKNINILLGKFEFIEKLAQFSMESLIKCNMSIHDAKSISLWIDSLMNLIMDYHEGIRNNTDPQYHDEMGINTDPHELLIQLLCALNILSNLLLSEKSTEIILKKEQCNRMFVYLLQLEEEDIRHTALEAISNIAKNSKCPWNPIEMDDNNHNNNNIHRNNNNNHHHHHHHHHRNNNNDNNNNNSNSHSDVERIDLCSTCYSFVTLIIPALRNLIYDVIDNNILEKICIIINDFASNPVYHDLMSHQYIIESLLHIIGRSEINTGSKKLIAIKIFEKFNNSKSIKFKISSFGGIEILIDCLKDPSESIRESAARLIGSLADIPELRKKVIATKGALFGLISLLRLNCECATNAGMNTLNVLCKEASLMREIEHSKAYYKIIDAYAADSNSKKKVPKVIQKLNKNMMSLILIAELLHDIKDERWSQHDSKETPRSRIGNCDNPMKFFCEVMVGLIPKAFLQTKISDYYKKFNVGKEDETSLAGQVLALQVLSEQVLDIIETNTMEDIIYLDGTEVLLRSFERIQTSYNFSKENNTLFLSFLELLNRLADEEDANKIMHRENLVHKFIAFDDRRLSQIQNEIKNKLKKSAESR